MMKKESYSLKCFFLNIANLNFSTKTKQKEKKLYLILVEDIKSFFKFPSFMVYFQKNIIYILYPLEQAQIKGGSSHKHSNTVESLIVLLS